MAVTRMSSGQQNPRNRDKSVRGLDLEELGKTIQLLYDAFYTVDSIGGSLSPFVPTQEYIVDYVVLLVETFLETVERLRKSPAVFYEPGCGTATITSRVASLGRYAICLELDPDLARMARDNTRSLLVDVVQGDLSVFRPRRASVAYAYLLPRAVLRLLEALEGLGTIVLSLDYPAEGDKGQLALTELRVMHRGIYVYKT